MYEYEGPRRVNEMKTRLQTIERLTCASESYEWFRGVALAVVYGSSVQCNMLKISEGQRIENSVGTH